MKIKLFLPAYLDVGLKDPKRRKNKNREGSK